MFSTMERKNSFAKNTKSAVARVRKGGYAYLTDDPILNYANKRKPCNTMLLRNLLQSQSYGLGLQQNSEWTNPISVKILNVSFNSDSFETRNYSLILVNIYCFYRVSQKKMCTKLIKCNLKLIASINDM